MILKGKFEEINDDGKRSSKCSYAEDCKVERERVTFCKDDYIRDSKELLLKAIQDSSVMVLTVEKLQAVNEMLDAVSLREVKSMDMAKFKVVRQIGSGSYGTVYLCVNPASHRHYAVKCIDKSKVNQTEFLQSLKREAKCIKKFGSYEYLIHQFKATEDAHYFYQVFAHVDGYDLETLRDMDLLNAVSVTGSLFFLRFAARKALHCLWGLSHWGLVHADLKLANLMVTAEGEFKLIDYGSMARLAKGKRIYERRGSPLYMSPEMTSRAGYSFATDFWSLGAVLYELYFHVPMIRLQHVNNVNDIYEAILKYDVKEDELLHSEHTDPEVADLLYLLLQTDQSARYDSIKPNNGIRHLKLFGANFDENDKNDLLFEFQIKNFIKKIRTIKHEELKQQYDDHEFNSLKYLV